MGALVINRAFAVAISFIFGWHVYIAILHFRPPFAYGEARAVPNVIHQGSTLLVEYDIDRVRLCKTDLVRFILREPDGLVVARESSPGGATLVGRNVVRNLVTSVKDLASGKYTLRAMVFSDCIDGAHAVAAPDVGFEIVD